MWEVVIIVCAVAFAARYIVCAIPDQGRRSRSVNVYFHNNVTLNMSSSLAETLGLPGKEIKFEVWRRLLLEEIKPGITYMDHYRYEGWHIEPTRWSYNIDFRCYEARGSSEPFDRENPISSIAELKEALERYVSVKWEFLSIPSTLEQVTKRIGVELPRKVR